MSAASLIDIAVLLPDVLGTYSDAGNATVLAQRLRWRGFAVRIVPVTAADHPPLSCELYVLGGGEDTAQTFAGQWLARHGALIDVLAGHAVTLAVCAGLQLLGHATTGADGRRRPGPGVLDLTTHPGAQRSVGESVSYSSIPGVGWLTGFHNHRGATTLASDATPLGEVRRGPGNRLGDPQEGALSAPDDPRHPATGPGVVATYLHGPVLARNPALADHLLARALGAPLPELDPARLPGIDPLRHAYLNR